MTHNDISINSKQIQLNRRLNSRVESVVLIVFVSVVGGDKAINSGDGGWVRKIYDIIIW